MNGFLDLDSQMLYDDVTYSDTTTLRQKVCIAGMTCIMAFANPIAGSQMNDYTYNTSNKHKDPLTTLTTSGSESEMSDSQLCERVAVLEANEKNRDGKIDDILTICSNLNTDMGNVAKSVARLEEGMTWVKGGVTAIAVTGVIALIKYLFFA